MFTVKGKIVFDPIDRTKKHIAQSSWKKSAIIMLECDTSDYYSWFIRKRFGLLLNRPLRGTHFTVINDKVITEEGIKYYEEAKEKWDGKMVELTYKPDYRTDDKHYWFRVYSEESIKIRNEAGLGKPHFGFHLTVGLVDEKRIKESEYIHRMMLMFPNNC